MLLAGFVGLVAGNIMGVVLMCLMVTGKREDQMMEQYRRQMQKRRKKIRFLDSCSQEAFTILDGESIELIAPNGESQTGVCRYVDEEHTSINGREWDLRDFAGEMEQRGIHYHPV
ncbi:MULTISPECIES: hypothetical protein [Clostridia]|uniref:hypothetical protein n=1 Tax=Clostridia TaxID=186801 RepID=UPI00067F491D|nr:MULTISPECIES: hypothetical protein [Clostridia]